MLVIPSCSIQKKDTSNFTSDDMRVVGSLLSGGAFKLYMYFLTYDDSSFYYERSACIGICGNSVNPINRAFTELVEKGFLKEESNKSFIFLKRPE